MDMRTTQRLALIVMGLFPAIWGLLGLLNDVTDFNDTLVNAVKPLIGMASTYGNPWQTWRAITAPWAAPVALIGIITVETLAGIFGTVGVILMLVRIRSSAAAFERGKVWMIFGSLFGVIIWGLGFMVIAGDWFLAWEAKTQPLSTQIGAMIYFVPCAIALLMAVLHREE
ncbi:MAG: DUF2165 family protein [Hyphomicrobium sp.]